VHAKQVTPVLRQQVVRFVRQEHTLGQEPQLARIVGQDPILPPLELRVVLLVALQDTTPT